MSKNNMVLLLNKPVLKTSYAQKISGFFCLQTVVSCNRLMSLQYLTFCHSLGRSKFKENSKNAQNLRDIFTAFVAFV